MAEAAVSQRWMQPLRIAADPPEENPQKATTASQRSRSNATVDGMFLLRCTLSSFLAELLGSFFLGFFAVAASDYAAAYGGGALSPLAVGAIFGAITFGLALTFDQVGSGQFNPALTLTQWFAEGTKAFRAKALVRYPSILIAQFLGYLLAAWLASGYAGGSAPLSCTNVDLALGQGYAFVAELAGVLVLCHVYLMTTIRPKAGPLAALGYGVTVGGLTAIFRTSSGGSFNLFRTLGAGIVEGCLEGDVWVYIVAFVVAPPVTWLLTTFIFHPSATTTLPVTFVPEKPKKGS